MKSFKEIKKDYRFTDEHEKLLVEMRPLMEENVDEVMKTLNSWMLAHKSTSDFFGEEARRRHVFDSQRQWFLTLFSGTYDQKFHDWLVRIGRVHVKHRVDPHYMSRAVNIVRNAAVGILSQAGDPSDVMASKIIALGKILDINLDIVNMAYFEEELKILAPVYKVKSFLIDFSEKFSNAMNLILVLALIGLTLGVVGLFFYDVQKLFHDDLYHGIISALGSLLILWVMIELMATEISHLKGGKFHISVFIGVALVTVIRDTMIAILKHDKPETVYMLVAAILVIGFIYWLVIKAEERLRD